MRRSTNTFKTIFLFGFLALVVMLAASWFGGSSGLWFGLILAIGMNGFAYFYSDRLALKAMRAYQVDPQTAPLLYKIVSDLAAEAKQPMPRVICHLLHLQTLLQLEEIQKILQFVQLKES